MGVIVDQLETLNGGPAPEELPKGDIAQRIAVLNGLMDKEDLKPSNGEICKQLDIYIENGGGGGTPTGTLNITQNGSYDVARYAEADVAVPQPSGKKTITANGTDIDIADYALADVNVSGGGGFDYSGLSGLKFSFNTDTQIDVSTLDTSGFTSMSNMFQGCSSLSSLDVSGFDTSNVTSMVSMFSGCAGLSSLDVSGFDTSNVTLMNNMFSACSRLSSLDVSGFDTSNVTSMAYMFNKCYSLSSLDVGSFDTSKVTDMGGMFIGCSGLSSLDLSGFDTSNVTSAPSVFNGTTNLTSIIWAIKSTTVQPCPHTAMFSGMSASTIFYVRPSLVSAYRSATNWSTISSQIQPLTSCPQAVLTLYNIDPNDYQ